MKIALRFLIILVTAFGLMVVAAALTASMSGSIAKASTTQVGNGDSGGDLEGASIIDDGPIITARLKAVEKLKNLHVEGIPGLGSLIPEVERSTPYMAARDVEADGAATQSFHSDMRGLLFARTFAEPNQPTRFFPVAKTLNQDQLVALQIHEGLHRALPASVREDEKIVTQITLAITSPEASHDRVMRVAQANIPEQDVRVASLGASGAVSAMGGIENSLYTESKYPVPEGAKIKNPSILGYTFKSFQNDPNNDQIDPLKSMHVLQSFLYPFGNDRQPVGIGIEVSLLNREKGGTELGPLSLSGRMRLWSSRGFDVGAWGVASLNTLSNEELKNTPYGRDVYSVGLSMEKSLRYFYIENLIGYSTAGEAKQQIGNVTYTHQYGGVTTATVRAGGKYKAFHLGGYGEIFLADYYRVNGGAYSFDSGRYQITAGGPELSIDVDNFSFGVFGRFLLSSSKDARFDYLGNVMGQGVGQGSVGATIAVKL